MKYRLDGNLAYDASDEKNKVVFSADYLRSSALPTFPPELPDFSKRREEEIEREKRRIERQEATYDAAIKRIHKNVGKEHLRTIVYCVVCLALIVGMFLFLLSRQAKIVEQNFQNTRIKNQINELNLSNSEEYEKLLSQVDMSTIESEAFRLYGLRKPAQAQRIHTNSPEVDRVIRHNQSQNISEDEFDTENDYVFNVSQIELYMNKLRFQE